MKVSPFENRRLSARSASQKKKPGNGRLFSQSLDKAKERIHEEDHSIDPLSPLLSLSAVSAVLGVQKIDSDIKKHTYEHGVSLLGCLEKLTLGLLEGKITENDLKELRHTMEKRPPGCKEQELSSIIDQIELRIHVELAKMADGRYGTISDPASAKKQG